MQFDVYTEKTIKLMVENKFDQYINVMGKVELPEYNKVVLIYSKIKEYEEAAKQEILKEAADRRAKGNSND